MKKTLYDYKDKIKRLPLKDKYTKEELLTEDFLIEKQGNIEIYYATHNEYINPKAKVLIVGITPGFIQMNIAISTARKELEILLNKKIYLELYVKTIKKWRDKEKYLQEFGFNDFE